MAQDPQEKFYFGDESIVIWRYLDLAELIWLLTAKSLWFARVDTLDDAHEGSPTEFAQHLRSLPDHSNKIAEVLQETVANLRARTFVNCWHWNQSESMAMWQIYSGAGLGVAIKSSPPRLLRAVGAGRVQPKHDLKCGIVRYGTITHDHGGTDALITPFLRKREAFEFERECRFVYQLSQPTDGLGEPWEVDLAELIDAVVVAPGTPMWVIDVVTAVVASFGPPGVQVGRSALDGPPSY